MADTKVKVTDLPKVSDPDDSVMLVNKDKIDYQADTKSFVQVKNNLSDVNPSVARSNLNVPSLDQLYAVADDIKIFPDTTSGLAGTTDGQYFRVPQDVNSESAFIYYVNNNGVAKSVASLPSTAFVIKNGVNKLIRPAGNIFNASTVTSGFYLFEGTGVPTANASYGYSDYIQLTPSTLYSSNNQIRVATFYDANKNYLSDLANINVFTAPDTARYVRVSVSVDTMSSLQLTFGLPYRDTKPLEIQLRKQIDGATLNVYPALGFVPGKNLFNPATCLVGYNISPDDGSVRYVESGQYSVSDFIEVDATKEYCCNQQWRSIGYYTALGVFISLQDNPQAGVTPIVKPVIPSNTKYLRIEVLTSVQSITQVEQNDVASDFEAYHLVAPSSFLNNAVQFASVDVSKQIKFKPANNLFNINSVTAGFINEFGAVIPTNPSSGTAYVYSDYIPVTASTDYAGSDVMRFIAFYDSGKEYISSRVSLTNFTTPATAAYVRVTITQSTAANLQLNTSKYVSELSSHKAVIDKLPNGTPVFIPGSSVLTDSLVIDFKKQGLLTSGKNLFNPYLTKAGYIDEKGKVNAGGTSYLYSDYIPVSESSSYIASSGLRFVAFYSATKGFISALADANQQLVSISTPAGASYMRVTLAVKIKDSLQVEAGTTATSFESYRLALASNLPDGTPVTGGSVVVDKTPDFYGLERLRETHMRLTKLTYGAAVRFVWTMLGDSYTRGEYRYATKTAQRLWKTYHGNSITSIVPPIGFGFRSFSFDPYGDNTDIVGTVVNQSGFTCAYNTGHGLDISTVTSSTAGSTISYAQDFTQGFTTTLYAEGGSGVLTYQATGQTSATTIDLSQLSSGLQTITLTLPTSGNGTVTFTTVSGTVALYGVTINNPTANGVTINKLGGSGSHSGQWVTAMNDSWKTAFKTLSSNLVSIMLGTNDQAALTPSQFKANLLTMIDNVRGQSPTTDILLIIPAENNRPGGNAVPMTAYAQAMYEIARDSRDVAFLNLQSSFGEKHADYANGAARSWMVSDGLHPDPDTGGYAISNAIIRALNLPAN